MPTLDGQHGGIMDNDISEFDIKTYLDDRKIDYKTSGKNIGKGWIGLNCILPGCSDNGNHLGVDLKRGVIKCWACQGKGTVLRLIQIIDKCSFTEAKKTTLLFPKDTTFTQNKKAANLPLSDQILPIEIQSSWPQIHLDYLRSRNFDPDQLIPKYQLMPVYNIGDWRFRIICPIIINRKIVSFVGADVTRSSELKYKNCPADQSVISVNHSLYNLDRMKDFAIIVEGITDVWRLGDGAVATFTNNFSPEQIALLASYKIKRAFVMYDRDELKNGEKESQAQKKQNKLASQLSGIIPYVETILLDNGDPADMSETEVQQLRKEIRI